MTNPSLEKMLEISEALACTIADLIGESKATAKADAGLKIPNALQEFAKRRKREGDPLTEDELEEPRAHAVSGAPPTDP